MKELKAVRYEKEKAFASGAGKKVRLAQKVRSGLLYSEAAHAKQQSKK